MQARLAALPAEKLAVLLAEACITDNLIRVRVDDALGTVTPSVLGAAASDIIEMWFSNLGTVTLHHGMAVNRLYRIYDSAQRSYEPPAPSSLTQL